MSRTDLSLILSAFSALAIVLGAMAAIVLAAFLAGVLIGERHQKGPGVEQESKVVREGRGWYPRT